MQTRSLILPVLLAVSFGVATTGCDAKDGGKKTEQPKTDEKKVDAGKTEEAKTEDKADGGAEGGW